MAVHLLFRGYHALTIVCCPEWVSCLPGCLQAPHGVIYLPHEGMLYDVVVEVVVFLISLLSGCPEICCQVLSYLLVHVLLRPTSYARIFFEIQNNNNNNNKQGTTSFVGSPRSFVGKVFNVQYAGEEHSSGRRHRETAGSKRLHWRGSFHCVGRGFQRTARPQSVQARNMSALSPVR